MKIKQSKDNEEFSQNSKNDSIFSQVLMDTPLMQQMSLEQDIISNSPLMQQKEKEHNKIFGTIQKKENKTGIPDNLKSGMESLSGINLDNVKVHYNSQKPKTLQAHAFASENEIHIASGQEKHLAHELGHVVQQAKGEVQPTTSVNGLAINDNPSLENQATQMGEKALQMKQIEGETSTNDENLTNNSSKPIQLISTQITFKESEEEEDDKMEDEGYMKNENDDKKIKIDQVIVRGRPKKVFSNSMGDHTTAFIVQVEGLNLKLQNQDLNNAIEILNDLINHLETLPGHKLLSGEIKKRFDKDYNELCKNIAEAEKEDDDNIKTHYLQEAINAYLSARELIPFSTINVGEKDKGASGKGHGESSYAKVLSTYERTEQAEDLGVKDDNELNEKLIEAISGLFDYQSASMLAVEQREDMIATMTAGISFAKEDVKERLGLIWNQHKLSIEKMFPKSYNKVEASLTEDKIEENIKVNIEKDIKSIAHEASSNINSADSFFLDKINNLNNQGKLNQTAFTNLMEVYKYESKLVAVVEELNELKNIVEKLELSNNAELLKEFDSNIKATTKKIEDYRALRGDEQLASYEAFKKIIDDKLNESAIKLKDELKREAPNSDNIKELTKLIKNLEKFKKGRPIKDYEPTKKIGRERKANPKYKDENDTEKRPTKKVKKDDAKEKLVDKSDTLTRAMGPMSIQLLLNPDGTIKEMKSDGRPKSPFKGTMGAHSTAWAVHLDRARAIVRGKDIATATEVIIKLLGEIETFANSQIDKNKKLGDNANASEENGKSLYNNSKANMLKYKSINPKDSNIATLQNIISAILSFYNLIPDVSRDKIDTGGKGEGVHRKTLLNYENYGEGTQEEIKIAINGLYDGRDRQGAMYENHIKIIEEAYPYSYEFFKDGTSHPHPFMREKKEDEEFEDESEEFEEDIETLGEAEKEKLRDEQKNQNQKWERNNCLINAITDAAGMPRADVETVIEIRRQIGARAGEMLFASTRILDIIARELGVDEGVIVINNDIDNADYIDKTSAVSDNPLFISHNGNNHFEANVHINIQENSKTKEIKMQAESSEIEMKGEQEFKEDNKDKMNEEQKAIDSSQKSYSSVNKKRFHSELDEKDSSDEEESSPVSSNSKLAKKRELKKIEKNEINSSNDM